MKKNIIFDGRWCGETGIGRFASEVKKAIPVMKDVSLEGNPAGKFDVFKITFFLIFNKGLFFSPGYNAPFLFLRRTVITVHDLNHVDLDFNSSLLKRMYYKLILQRACKRSAGIFTVSEFSKDRIVDWADVNPSKVTVVGNGVSEEFNLEAPKSNLGYQYVFVVGNRKKHKNEVKALEAFLSSELPITTKIVFSGVISESISDVIKKNNAESRVFFTGRLSNSELASMYRGALLLLFPSLYEGFGIPVIEAMACGTPVVTSNTTSLVEIAGNAACLVEPESIESITTGINRVYNDPIFRNELISLGLEQSKKYTWDKTTDLIKKTLDEL